ncbi:ABC transporter ATP-binding protein [Catenulispora yoronensis]|uniref:ABC transporter ATP-binding protein n=1 Tax=Catenulispora yoronensis TaxID=450799 RepID=A0ABP5F566_9ACTN
MTEQHIAARVENLCVDVATRDGSLRAVDGASLTIAEGEVFGLVGESGCGKTTLGMAIAGLLPSAARTVAGTVSVAGRTLTGLRERELRRIRGDLVGVVFQDPMTTLNPTMKVGRQVAEPFRLHRDTTARAARHAAEQMLDLVGLPNPGRVLDAYPHQLSGGMRQRVCIAAALICRPKLLIADEPTTALDVTTQDQILRLFQRLRAELGMSILLVTHDMGVIAANADRVGVMYAGQLAEVGPVLEIFDSPQHRYTRALLESVPTLDTDLSRPLRTIPGLPPRLDRVGPGCRFAPRCGFADDACSAADLPWRELSPMHSHRCVHPRGLSRAEHSHG